jgi:hypothetical protein
LSKNVIEVLLRFRLDDCISKTLVPRSPTVSAGLLIRLASGPLTDLGRLALPSVTVVMPALLGWTVVMLVVSHDINRLTVILGDVTHSASRFFEVFSSGDLLENNSVWLQMCGQHCPYRVIVVFSFGTTIQKDGQVEEL